MTHSSPSKTLVFGATAALFLSATTQSTAQSGAVNFDIEDPVLKAQFLEDIGASERINFSGKLRMLSQRIPAAACMHHAGVVPEQSKAVLDAAVEEFDKIVNALEHGDETLNIIGGEERRLTLAAIESLHAAYDPLHTAMEDIEATGGTDAEVLELAEHNMEVLEAAKLLVSEISGQYADPTALLQSDALTIDIAGRQRMLTQKISKEVCLASTGIYSEASLETLGGTVNMFETSLNALIFGMDGAGIAPAPTAEILTGLETVQADWAQVRDYVQTVATGGSVDEDTLGMIFTGLNKTMADMNAVVGLYTENSKLGL